MKIGGFECFPNVGLAVLVWSLEGQAVSKSLLVLVARFYNRSGMLPGCAWTAALGIAGHNGNSDGCCTESIAVGLSFMWPVHLQLRMKTHLYANSKLDAQI